MRDEDILAGHIVQVSLYSSPPSGAGYYLVPYSWLGLYCKAGVRALWAVVCA